MSNRFLPGTQKELQDSLEDLNRKMQEEETQAKAGSLALPYIDLHKFPVDLSVLGLFTEDLKPKKWVRYRFTKTLAIYALGVNAKPLYLSPTTFREKLMTLFQKNKITLYFISKKAWTRR